MTDGVVRALSAIGRRKFVGQVSAAAAAVFAGGMTFGERRLEAHEERMTMAAAVLGREWGIVTYRVRLSGRKSADERLVSSLLGQGNVVIGEFVRNRHMKL